jgi:hypothetical protein
MATLKERIEAARKAASSIDGDVYLYNGPMLTGRDLSFIEEVHASKRKDKVTLFLTTGGGDPDAAYKMARYLQDRYDYVTVVVSGKCKSAGTLIAIGANELVFTPYGELGPLDIQLTKVDRLDQLQSGLTIQDALTSIEDRAIDKFNLVAKNWIEANQGLISFASATQAAAEFVSNLYAPIFARIDPEEVGAKTRAMRIATDYGHRLALKSQNLKPQTLRLLAETYSSHSFVIDQQEAKTLFNRVRSAADAEQAVVDALERHARFPAPTASEYACFALHDMATGATSGAVNDQTDRARNPVPNGGNPAGANGSSHAPAPGSRKRVGRRGADSPGRTRKPADARH